MQAGILVVVAGAVINAAIVTSVTDRYYFIIGVIPAIACEIILLSMTYQEVHRYQGMSLSAFFGSNRFSVGRIFFEMIPAAVTSGIFHGYWSRRRLIQA